MLSLAGAHLILSVGWPPRPAPVGLIQALESASVNHDGDHTAGFSVTFRAERSLPAGAQDSPILTRPELQPFERLHLALRFGAAPYPLIDGVILDLSYDPSSERLTVSGGDLSKLMDRDETPRLRLANNTHGLIMEVLNPYLSQGLTPKVPTLQHNRTWEPQRKENLQAESDLSMLRRLARDTGSVFRITPLLRGSLAYLGPEQTPGAPQRALTANMGPASNVNSISFSYRPDGLQEASGQTIDPKTGEVAEVRARPEATGLAARPAMSAHAAQLRRTWVSEGGAGTPDGAATGAQQRASAHVASASGELDCLRYGRLLQPHQLVDVRGVGWSYGGRWWVQSVDTQVRKGELTQRFSLSRDGLGALSPRVQT